MALSSRLGRRPMATSEYPAIEEQVAELLERGWKRRTTHVWISPRGAYHIGPHGAWMVMRGLEEHGTVFSVNGLDNVWHDDAMRREGR